MPIRTEWFRRSGKVSSASVSTLHKELPKDLAGKRIRKRRPIFKIKPLTELLN